MKHTQFPLRASLVCFHALSAFVIMACDSLVGYQQNQPYQMSVVDHKNGFVAYWSQSETSCKSFGAAILGPSDDSSIGPGTMSLPSRCMITWRDGSTSNWTIEKGHIYFVDSMHNIVDVSSDVSCMDIRDYMMNVPQMEGFSTLEEFLELLDQYRDSGRGAMAHLREK